MEPLRSEPVDKGLIAEVAFFTKKFVNQTEGSLRTYLHREHYLAAAHTRHLISLAGDSFLVPL